MKLNQEVKLSNPWSVRTNIFTEDLTWILDGNNNIRTIMSSINYSKDLEIKSIDSCDTVPRKWPIQKENSYYDSSKISKKNNNSLLSKLGANFATEDWRK